MIPFERHTTADAIVLPGEHVGRAAAAEARWTSLRGQITRDIAIEQQLGDDYSDMGTEESEDSASKHWARAEALRDVLATMDRMERDA